MLSSMNTSCALIVAAVRWRRGQRRHVAVATGHASPRSFLPRLPMGPAVGRPAERGRLGATEPATSGRNAGGMRGAAVRAVRNAVLPTRWSVPTAVGRPGLRLFPHSLHRRPV